MSSINHYNVNVKNKIPIYYIYIYILLYFIYFNILRLKVNIVTKDIDYQIVRKRKLTQSQHLVNTHL
jgi:hypothetical protein